MAQIIDGKAIASDIRKELKSEILVIPEDQKPKFAVILIGADDSSVTYLRSLEKSAEKLGIKYEEVIDLSDRNLSPSDEIHFFANDKSFHGILLMRPLPPGYDENNLTSLIPPEKDIDCANPLSMGLLATGRPKMLPPTPAACVEILKRSGINTSGKLVGIVGRSNVVGKPLALMLARKGEGDATVVLCHSRTRDLAFALKDCEIVIAAAGSPKLITADMIKEGAVVVDAGINWTDKGMTGDVDFELVKEKASMITPVPGGVGPVTRVMLFSNLLRTYKPS